MRRTLFLLTCAAATALSTSFASATMLITADRGGLIIDYVERFLEARASGEPVVIDGPCLSACTLVVGVLPRGQVCATPKAVLGFHAAWRPTAGGGRVGSYAATRAMMDVYPADLRSWIGRHGGLTPRLIVLRGRELAAMVPACGSATTLAASATRAPRVLSSDTARARFDAQQAR